MDLNKLHRILIETEIPVVYDQFEEGGVPPLPWIAFYETDLIPFPADDGVYFAQQEIAIELYTDKKDPESEEILESVLRDYNFYYTKSETAVIDESLCMIVYTIRILK